MRWGSLLVSTRSFSERPSLFRHFTHSALIKQVACDAYRTSSLATALFTVELLSFFVLFCAVLYFCALAWFVFGLCQCFLCLATLVRSKRAFAATDSPWGEQQKSTTDFVCSDFALFHPAGFPRRWLELPGLFATGMRWIFCSQKGKRSKPAAGLSVP